MFFACGICCVADVSSVRPSSEQSQPLLIKPVLSLLANAEKQGFFQNKSSSVLSYKCDS